MKLAEALMLRSDLQNKMDQLKYRLDSNIMIQEGDDPKENPRELLEEYDKTLEEFELLVGRINRTNNKVELEDGRSISDALVKRDCLLKKRNLLASIAEGASIRQDRYSRTEVKYVSTVDVVLIQKKIDSISKEYRDLDNKIQGLNWTTELL